MDENNIQSNADNCSKTTESSAISPVTPEQSFELDDLHQSDKLTDYKCSPQFCKDGALSVAFLDQSVADSAVANALKLIHEKCEKVAPSSHTDDNLDASIEENLESMKNQQHEKNHETFESKLIENSQRRSSSLSEDSRLVKISLPTNSINLIQSNAQFLNKSRNFLNFITEKSTNIMEKALLPQHIAVRYGSNDKKTLQDAKNEYGSLQNVSENASEIHTKSVLSISNGKEVVTTQSTKLILNIPHLHSKSFSESFNSMKINSLNLNSTVSTCELQTATSINGELKPETEQNYQQSSTNSDDNNIKVMTVDDFTRINNEKLILIERIKQLEETRNDSSEIENREKIIERLTNELRTAVAIQEEMRTHCSAANRERESMVMKYAVGEKQLIDTQRAKDAAEKKVKDVTRENELLQNKLKQALGERTRICGILDTKCKDLLEAQREVERLKEDMSVKDVKLKWTQTKLKTEMELQKETQQKLDKALAKINEMKEECEQVRRESQETIRKFQQSEENKAVTLDHQLKEQQARLILERHVTEDKEILRLQLQKEVESLKNRQQALIEENNALSLKIQDLEEDRLSYESNLSNLKFIADQKQKELMDLAGKVSHLETLKLQLIHKEQCLASNEAEVERLRLVNQELQTDMDCCRQREAHMLEFTQKLTDKNVRIQSEFTAIESKANQLEIEQGPLRELINELELKVKLLEKNLANETNKRIEECDILAKHLAEKTQLAQNLSQKLEDSQGEYSVLKRKYQASLKEMTRELQQYRKRLESYEASSSPTSSSSGSSSKSLVQTPRTSSNTSLNNGDTPNTVSSSEYSTSYGEFPLAYNELDKNSLIDRILKMQKINVKRAEKLDFLEEHTRALVAELQKKTKIIQNYIFHENFDAMASNERDKYKAELARHGGIMASVYNHRVSDENMTLELSLEINQKLQAVLEDALLKNITLKDNIDTLGEEIARLTMKNQQLQKSMK